MNFFAKNNIKWLLFDIGYTLINEDMVWFERCKEQAKTKEAIKLGITAKDIYDEIVNAAKNFLPQYKSVVDKYKFKEIAPYRKEYERIYENAPVVLEELSQKFNLAIIANQESGLVDRLNNWGIAKYFQYIFSSSDFGLFKPDLRFFQLALSKMGCKADECAMIGDRLDNDIIPAKTIGMKTIWVKQGFGAFQAPRNNDEKPDIEVENLKGLLSLRI